MWKRRFVLNGQVMALEYDSEAWQAATLTLVLLFVPLR